jgi:hypothetical protein
VANCYWQIVECSNSKRSGMTLYPMMDWLTSLEKLGSEDPEYGLGRKTSLLCTVMQCEERRRHYVVPFLLTLACTCMDMCLLHTVSCIVALLTCACAWPDTDLMKVVTAIHEQDFIRVGGWSPHEMRSGWAIGQLQYVHNDRLCGSLSTSHVRRRWSNPGQNSVHILERNTHCSPASLWAKRGLCLGTGNLFDAEQSAQSRISSDNPMLAKSRSLRWPGRARRMGGLRNTYEALLCNGGWYYNGPQKFVWMLMIYTD